MKRNPVRLAILFAACLVTVCAQTTFEAATIKLNKTMRAGSGMDLQPARVRIINSTLKFCIAMAWHVQSFQISGGPDWAGNERYDIDAVAATPFKGEDYRTMLQALLKDRFGLVTHREIRERQGYALVPARKGAKLPPPVEDPSIFFSRTPSGEISLQATSATLTQLADVLSSRLETTIVDRTGIEGKFDVSLQYTPGPADEPVGKANQATDDPAAGPSIFTALQDKLGLRLEPAKVPVEMIVIDRVARPSEQ